MTPPTPVAKFSIATEPKSAAVACQAAKPRVQRGEGQHLGAVRLRDADIRRNRGQYERGPNEDEVRQHSRDARAHSAGINPKRLTSMPPM